MNDSLPVKTAKKHNVNRKTNVLVKNNLKSIRINKKDVVKHYFIAIKNRKNNFFEIFYLKNLVVRKIVSTFVVQKLNIAYQGFRTIRRQLVSRCEMVAADVFVFIAIRGFKRR